MHRSSDVELDRKDCRAVVCSRLRYTRKLADLPCWTCGAGVTSIPSSHTHRGGEKLSSNCIFVDLLLLHVVNTHKCLDGFDDALGVPDEVMVGILWRETIGESP